MIKVRVKSNTEREDIIVEASATPNQAFTEAGITPARSIVNLDGRNLSAADLNKSFTDLGIDDGSDITLTAIVKMDGANR